MDVDTDSQLASSSKSITLVLLFDLEGVNKMYIWAEMPVLLRWGGGQGAKVD